MPQIIEHRPKTRAGALFAPGAPGAGKRRAVLARVCGSTALILLALLLGANALSARFDATNYVRMEEMNPQEAAQRAISYKMSELEKAPAAPDVLMVGSSLPMSVAFYADNGHYKQDLMDYVVFSRIHSLNPFQAYPRAVYFSDLLSKHFGRPTSVFNLTVPACMTSDGHFLLSEALARKTPRMVIWGIAPRDFVDNVIPPIGKTPAFTALPAVSFLPNVLSWQTSLTDGADSVMAACVRFYNERRTLKHVLNSWAARTLDHPESLQASVKKDQSVVEAKPVAQALAPVAKPVVQALAPAAKPVVQALAPAPKPAPDTREPGWNESLRAQYKDYDARYNPPNFKLLNSQLDHLKRAIALCKSKGVKVVLVNMPLPRKHQTLIDQKLHDAYRTKVAAVAAANGAVLLDLNHPDVYNADDWMDSLHVTASGADKFLDELVPQL